MDHNTRTIKTVVFAILGLLSLLYLGQGFLLKFRLDQIGSTRIDPTLLNESCDQSECTSVWNFNAGKRFLLLGHILRTHRLIDTVTGNEISPITQVRGTVADSWVRLRVYAISPSHTYTVIASKPAATKMPYFFGILPRESDHPGILSIPDIGPTIALITGLSLAFILSLMFSAAYMGGISFSRAGKDTGYFLNIFILSAVLTSTATFTSLGILDTLLPEGDLRNKVLRISFIVSFLIPIFATAIQKYKKIRYPTLIILSIITLIVSNHFWQFIRGGISQSLIMFFFCCLSSLNLYRMHHRIPAALWSLWLIDSAKVAGLWMVPDYPPVYFGNVAILSALVILAGELGGFSTISLAGVAYRRFKRDVVLSSIQQSFESVDQIDSSQKLVNLGKILPDLVRLVGADRISVTINLPLGRPITLSYQLSLDKLTTFDDGKIPGSVTLRCLIYGDEAMFESFNQFADRVRVPRNPNLQDLHYLCAVPLRVNHTIVGAMMITGFDDSRIKSRSAQRSLQEDQESIHLIADRLSHSLSKLIVKDMSAISVLSKDLQGSIHKAIAASSSSEEYLLNYMKCIRIASQMSVMIHEAIGDRAFALGHIGLKESVWKFFAETPMNLKSDHSVGPTVVAFRDQKSSYVKDILELTAKLHPKTTAAMHDIGAMSVVAIPLKSYQRSYVMTLIGQRSAGAADPSIVAVAESTEGLFVAAMEVMSQKSSAQALGQITSRLIGDKEVRQKIIDAAKSQELPTIVGSPRESFLLLFDLIGSSDLPDDTESKARAYGHFYDAVNQYAQKHLGGLIRKTIGDAIIITWDGTAIDPTMIVDFEQEIMNVCAYADEVAKSIGCRGSRAVLHYGKYFLGLVGTQTFGQIDVIGSGIDEVCKIETNFKSLSPQTSHLQFLITHQAFEHLNLQQKSWARSLYFSPISMPGFKHSVYRWEGTTNAAAS